MNSPIPAPRNLSSENKRPVPTPRRLIPIQPIPQTVLEEPENEPVPELPKRNVRQSEYTINEEISKFPKETLTKSPEIAQVQNLTESKDYEATKPEEPPKDAYVEVLEDSSENAYQTIEIHFLNSKESNSPQTRSSSQSDNSSKEESTKPEPQETNTNTFSKRVRTLSNTSKQIVEEIRELMIESTRQSVRRIAKRSPSVPCDSSNSEIIDKKLVASQSDLNIFKTITFESPLHRPHTYVNVSIEDAGSEESLDIPPPNYPPPPLRNEPYYDEPQSVISGSTGSSGSAAPSHVTDDNNSYEYVYPNLPNSSDTDSCTDMTAGTFIQLIHNLTKILIIMKIFYK